jgi:hypothetical protein
MSSVLGVRYVETYNRGCPSSGSLKGCLDSCGDYYTIEVVLVVRLCVVRSSSQVVSSQYSPQTTDQESRTVRRRRTDARTKGTTKYK